MKDPLPKNYKSSNYQHYSGGGYVQSQRNGSSSSSGISGGSAGKRNKSDYCWNFNKGIPCKFGSKCKFIERCKYCDSPSHGVNACMKLQRKAGGSSGGNEVNSSSNSSGASK